MIITIKRIRIKGVAIDGHLYIDGMKVCDCAENAKSCLPVGSYPVVRHKCKQYARFVPVILSGSMCSPESLSNQCQHCKKMEYCGNNSTLPCFCPQIKPGNGIYHREDGSIIVGKYIAPGCLIHPKEPFENLCERLRKLDGRGSEVTLVIEEQYPAPTPRLDDLTPYQLGTMVLDQMSHPSHS